MPNATSAAGSSSSLFWIFRRYMLHVRDLIMNARLAESRDTRSSDFYPISSSNFSSSWQPEPVRPSRLSVLLRAFVAVFILCLICGGAWWAYSWLFSAEQSAAAATELPHSALLSPSSASKPSAESTAENESRPGEAPSSTSVDEVPQPTPPPETIFESKETPTAPATRQWTNRDGRQISAAYLGFNRGKVRLQRSDRKESWVPLLQLSVADRVFVLEQEGQTNPTDDAPSLSLRPWSDRSGAQQTTAALVDSTENIATLLKSDGSIIDVPVDRLSDEDRRYIFHQLAVQNVIAGDSGPDSPRN
jgi:hypothetical protein